MKRVCLIDGLRGYFLVFMFINHLNVALTGGVVLRWVNHAGLGFVEDAQGFIFLSGLMVGMVYGPRMLKLGFAAAASGLWRRAVQLYAYMVCCVAAIAVLREILSRAPEAWNDWLGQLGDGNATFVIAAALLLYQPYLISILAQYIIYLMVAPPLLWLCLTGRWFWVALGSAMLWLAVQVGLHLPLAQAINAQLSHFDPDLAMRVPFNVLAWQAPFFGAMVIGALSSQGKLEFGRVFDPDKTVFVRVFALSLIFFLVLRRGLTFEIVPSIAKQYFWLYASRGEFALVYLLNFILLAYVIAWLLIAGPRSKDQLVIRIGDALRFVFGLSFLRLLGRHSLVVYAWHVVLIYMIVWSNLAVGPFAWVARTAIAICGIAMLALPAVYGEWHGSRGFIGWRRSRPATS
jgi:hypothetical protein